MQIPVAQFIRLIVMKFNGQKGSCSWQEKFNYSKEPFNYQITV